jgi:hypothetical protein
VEAALIESVFSSAVESALSAVVLASSAAALAVTTISSSRFCSEIAKPTYVSTALSATALAVVASLTGVASGTA